MTPTAAARKWLEAKRHIAPWEAQLKESAEVLKAHFADSGLHEFRGVGYAKSTFQALSVKLARAALGNKAAACMEDRTRETLSDLKPPTTA